MPFTSFSEYEGKPPEPVRFALSEERPVALFAGIWTRWTAVRKLKEGATTNDLYGFLTTQPNAVVAPIHPKAMPVILNRSNLRSPRAATAACRRCVASRRTG
ncbi:SOS response-associated peptidase [Palleronia marisminoris]|uniref:SOS response-associated peptidase n=1 Tax=Palleronia marisminoris TaxID=315423 RepID=UPI000A81CCF1|nr:SOS response-associated peptidase [Palleronia marisminoris]